MGEAVRPSFAGLEGLDNRMGGTGCVCSGVPVRRAVAAAHMTALHAQPEMDPGGTDPEAVLTAVRVGRLDGVQRFEVMAGQGAHSLSSPGAPPLSRSSLPSASVT